MKPSTKVIVVLAVVVPAIVVSVWRLMNPAPDRSIVQAASELAQAKAEIEALGLTLDPVEFGRRLQVPVDDDAGPIIQEVAQDIFTLGGFSELFSGEDHVAKCVEFDRLHPEVLEELRLAASKSGCDFQRDWSLGLNIMFPEFASMKSLVKYCSHLAEADALEKQYDSALEKLLIADRIASFSDADRTVIGHLVTIAGKIIIESAIVRILMEESGDPAVQDLVREYVVRAAQLNQLDSCLEGELIMASTSVKEFSETYEQLFSDDQRILNSLTFGKNETRHDERTLKSIRSVERRVLADASLAVYLRYLGELYGHISRDASWDETMADVAAFEASLDEAASPSDLFMQIVRSEMSILMAAHGRSVAMLEMLALVADVLDRTRGIGLAAAVKEHDSTVYDRINGGYFRVIMADPGFKVYSIGIDAIDAGGTDSIGRDSFHNESRDDFGYWIPYD